MSGSAGARPARVLAVDLGATWCKAALTEVNGARIAVDGAVLRHESKPFLHGVDGFATFGETLSRLAGADGERWDGLALALPVAVSYFNGGVEPPGMSWPRAIRNLEAALGKALAGAPVAILNDSVAFTLGAIELDPSQEATGRTLYLTLGTDFGAAIGEPLIGMVTPIELNPLLRNHHWPNGHVGTPAQLFMGEPYARIDAREWEPDDRRAYGEMTGWVAGEVIRRRACGDVVLGGGRANVVDPGDVARGMEAVGAAPLPIRLDGRDATAVVGAAVAWRARHVGRQPLSELIAEPWMHDRPRGG